MCRMPFLSLATIILKRNINLRSYPALTKSTSFVVRNPSFSSVPTKTIHDVNTNVAKDVILFKYENPKFFKYMNVFAVVQYIICTYLGMFAIKSLKDAPVDKSMITDDTPWYKRLNLGENKYRNTLGALGIFIGIGTLSMVWMYTLRSVRYLILNKGGKHVTFVTYSPFGTNRIMKVPMENVCCKESRSRARVQLPIKVKNIFMHYLLDMNGEFKNPVLFDSTAGLARKL